MRKKLSCLIVLALIFTSFSGVFLVKAEDAKFFESTVLTYPVVKKEYKLSDDFSSVQGGNNWYYMTTPRKTDEYMEMPFYEQYAFYSAFGWKFASNSWQYGIINPNYTSSGFDQEPVLAFRAPVAGTINIEIPEGLTDKGAGGDGIWFNICHVSSGTKEKLFPKGDDTFYAVPHETGKIITTPFEPIQAEVKAGDYIYFRVNMGANSSNDNLFYNPRITYTSDLGIYLSKNYTMLDIEDGRPVSETLAYEGGDADSISWLSSDTSVVKVLDGVVTPVKAGSAYVTLKAVKNGVAYESKTAVDVVNRKNPKPFAAGDVIGMWGDSLTHGGNYAQRIEEFYVTQYPNDRIDMPKFGYSGDDTIDVINRVSRDFNTRPDVNRATILLGANDFALTPQKLTTQDVQTYRQRIIKIVDVLKAKGVKDITLITPTPFDAIRSGNYGRAMLMHDYCYELRKIASDTGCAIVDAWTVMDYYDTQVKKGHEISPSMPSILSDDNLHPSDLGYMILAYAILDAQGVIPNTKIPSAVIDAGAGTVKDMQNCSVSDLKKGSDSLSFVYKPLSMPYPKTEGFTQFEALEKTIGADIGNKDILKITGLDLEKEYAVQVGTGKKIIVTGSELADGINMYTASSELQTYANNVTSAAGTVDTYDDSLINILNTESKYLDATDVLTTEEGIERAREKVESGKLNEGTANAYISWKNSESSWKTKLAAAWDSMYAGVKDKSVTVTVSGDVGEEPTPTPTPDIPSKAHYDAKEDMSDTQGKNCWYYRGAPVGKYSLSDYVDFQYHSSGYWLLKNGDYSYGRIRMQAGEQSLDSGNAGDSALTFQAPVNGTIRISMKDNKITELSSIDIHRLRIYKNEEIIFPQDGGWLTLKEKEQYNFQPVSVDVTAGDQIIFRTNKGAESLINTDGIKNDGDKLSCIPMIDYTAMEEKGITVTASAFEEIEGKIKASVTVKNTTGKESGAAVIFALYNDGTLSQTEIQNSTLALTENSFSYTFDPLLYSKAKIIVIDNFELMKPLAEAKEWKRIKD